MSLTSRHAFPVVLLLSAVAFGQNQPGNQGQNQFPGGITISPDGVIGARQAQRINPALQQRRMRELAAARLSSDLATVSPLRKISLVRLEAACRTALDAGQEIPIECRCLAGVTQLQYLFASPESGDVVLAGPAEPFAPLPDGRVVGVETGRPVLTLDDLLVMLRLRTYRQQLGCSFDPDPTRLANAQAWNRANSSPATINVAQQRFFQTAKILGAWNVTVFRLPADSHAAITAVEADYQLKRLALGLEHPGIRGFRSYLDLAGRNENTMRRWWFAPRYEVIERSEDGNAFHLQGPRLQLLSQEELVDIQGNRSDAAFTEISAERYTKQFNRHLDALCQRVPSFAAVQNLFDLAVTAALLQAEQLPQRVGWMPDLFYDDQQLPLKEFQVPAEVPSLVNVKQLNRSLLIGLVGGGVTIVPEQVISRTNRLSPESTPPVTPPADAAAWWWD
ncbi:MAG: DUF1598 domain-containing protein [Fuerstiella sp.]